LSSIQQSLSKLWWINLVDWIKTTVAVDSAVCGDGLKRLTSELKLVLVTNFEQLRFPAHTQVWSNSVLPVGWLVRRVASLL